MTLNMKVLIVIKKAPELEDYYSVKIIFYNEQTINYFKR